MSSSVLKFPVHVEAQIRDSCMTPPEEIVVMLTEILQSSCPVFHNGELDLARTENIGDFCESVAVSDMEEGQFVSFWQADLSVHAYRLTEEEPVVILHGFLLHSHFLTNNCYLLCCDDTFYVRKLYCAFHSLSWIGSSLQQI